MAIDPASIDYLLFDHDGVLVDTEYWYYRATQQAIAELGVELTLARYRRHLVDGAVLWALAHEAGHDDATIAEARHRRNAYYQQHLQQQDIDIPGVGAALTRLRRRFRMAIVTTARRDDFELIHKDRDIVRHMEFVLCSGEYPRAKPHPDPYLTALDRFGARRVQALVIEDSERGLRAAVAAGITCVTVHHEFTAHQDLGAAAAHVGSLAELVDLLGC